MLFRLLILLCFIFVFLKALKAEDYVADTIPEYLTRSIAELKIMSSDNPDSAMIRINSVLDIASFYEMKLEMAELIRIKGLVYFYKVDYVKALDCFVKSRDINQNIGNLKGEASAISNISLVYSAQGLLKKNLELELQALEIREKLGDKASIAASINNVGVAYRDMNDYKTALLFYKKAVEISLEIEDYKSLDLYYNNVGAMFLLLNKPDSALQFFEKSLVIGRKNGDKQMICNSLQYYGEYYLSIENYTEAIKVLKKSLQLAQEIGIVYEIESVASNLHRAYASAGNFNQAYKMLMLYKQMNDSANNIKTMERLAIIETTAIFEKENELQRLLQSQKEIQSQMELHKQKQFKNFAYVMVFAVIVWLFLLYLNYRGKIAANKKLIAHRNEILAQKEEIETQRDEIEALNLTKDKFFAIIAHDLKNPVSGVYRLAEIMETNYEFLDNKKLKEYIEQIHKSSKKTYELLENLLSWAMMQTGSIKIEPTVFNLTTIIKENIDLLYGNSKPKKIKVEFPYCDECMAFADIKMVKTVVRNLLHNAIKFSPENSTINFSISSENKFWKVAVQDKGMGIKYDDQKYLFETTKNNSKIGKSKDKGTGLGLVLCKEFIELNKGKIWVESEENNGTTFYFTIPAYILA